MESARPGLAKLGGVAVSLASVTAFDGLAIPAIVYLPEPRPAGRKLATVVAFHGGPAWASSAGWSALVRFLVARGHAVVTPNVRGSTGFGRAYETLDDREKRLDVLKDMEAVAAWVGAQPWGDAKRLVIHGATHGGQAALPRACTKGPSRPRSHSRCAGSWPVAPRCSKRWCSGRWGAS